MIRLRIGSTWNPGVLSLGAWYDASDASTIVESSGNVSSIADKSGNGNTLSQGNGSLQPTIGGQFINGADALHFYNTQVISGTGLSGLTSTEGFTVVMIGKLAVEEFNLQEFYSLKSADGTDAMLGRRDGIDSHSVNFTGDGGGTNFPRIKFTNTERYGVGVPYIATHYYDNNAHYCDGNGGQDTISRDMPNNVSLDFSELNLGRTQNQTNTAIGEIVFVKGYSLEMRQKLEGYLAWKWGIQANLPVGHPYKDVAP